MIYTVYVLYAANYNKHYTGFTSNLMTRLQSHNNFGKDWTADFRPWKLIYTKNFNSKAEAIKYERWLKTGVGRDFITALVH